MKRHQIISLGVLFLVALVIRLDYQYNTRMVDPIRADSLKYVTIANNLIDNGIYSDVKNATKPRYHVTPGYPFYLAAILKLSSDTQGAAYKVIQYSQAIMGALVSILAVLIALHFIPFRFAYLAGILTSLSPHLITVGFNVLTEPLFIFLLILAIWILLRGLKSKSIGWLVVSGLLFGSAALVRPAIIAFPLFILPLLFLSRQWRGWRAPTALLVAAFMVFGCWVGWQTLHSKQADTSPSLLANSIALGIYPNLIHKNPSLQAIPYREDPSFSIFADNIQLTLQTLWQRAQKDPLNYIQWYLIGKPVMFWSKNILRIPDGIYVYPVIQSPYDSNFLARRSMQMMQFIHPYLLITVLFGAIILSVLPEQKIMTHRQLTATAIIFALLLYATLIHMALTPLPRYSIPFRPFLYIAFSTSLYYLIEILRKPGLRK